MGLYVWAGSKATFITTDLEAEDTGPNENYVIGPDFPERLDSYPEGTYRFDGDIFEFFAGGFSDFNTWRQQFSELVLGVPATSVWENPDAYQDRPFFEFLYFGDNEGAIGPKTSRKLAQDFANYAERLQNNMTVIQTYVEYGTGAITVVHFGEQYANFRQAFEVASDDGFVIFC